MTHAADVSVVAHTQALIGESPVWDEDTGSLWWVDILRGELHRSDVVSGENRSWRVPTALGAIALRAGGGFVAAAGDGFCLLDPDADASFSAPLRWLWREGMPDGSDVPPSGWPNGQPARMNDGKCDPAGRFWAGTMTIDRTPGASHLYRLDPDGTVHAALDGVTLSNGMAWSPNGTTMYYIDTGQRTVDAFDFDVADGVAHGRRTLIAVEDGAGNPDGMTVDAEGSLWVALARGAAIRRYSPAGRLDRILTMPVQKVTSCTFGGPGLRTLFVTTACVGLSEAELVAEPLAGAVLGCEVGVGGLPPHRFAG